MVLSGFQYFHYVVEDTFIHYLRVSKICQGLTWSLHTCRCLSRDRNLSSFANVRAAVCILVLQLFPGKVTPIDPPLPREIVTFVELEYPERYPALGTQAGAGARDCERVRY